jgi:hypothetical protein
MTDETTNAEEFAEDMEVAAEVPVPVDVAYAADAVGAPEDAATAVGGGRRPKTARSRARPPTCPGY